LPATFESCCAHCPDSTSFNLTSRALHAVTHCLLTPPRAIENI
jgi:hypothetical protein